MLHGCMQIALLLFLQATAIALGITSLRHIFAELCVALVSCQGNAWVSYTTQKGEAGAGAWSPAGPTLCRNDNVLMLPELDGHHNITNQSP